MSRPRRALWISHAVVFGGPHNDVVRLVRPMAARGWEMAMAVPRATAPAERLRAEGVRVHDIPLHRLRNSKDPREFLATALTFPSEVWSIRNLVRREGYDLVVVNGLLNPHGGFAARLAGVPLVWKVIDTNTPRLAKAAAVRTMRALADVLLFDGHALVEDHLGGRPARQPVHVYYPGVDMDEFRPDAGRRAEVRREFGIPAEAPVVGMVANLSPMKGIEYFIRAAALIARARPDAYFLHVGGEHATPRWYVDRVEEEWRTSGIAPDRIIRPGSRNDVARLYPAMDVKLITSIPRSEGTTYTAEEALASGVPVVCTAVGAVPEVIEDGVDGFVVPPLDAAALAAATLRILDDSALRAALATGARRQAALRFSDEVCADTHLAVFEAALAARGLLTRA